ncbi:MAG TPA: hypothetical protein VEB19_02385 [Gemmatimonadaceae bacterium]|nr:hypothetical protein [Gemmatimonadaceae bacterium]
MISGVRESAAVGGRLPRSREDRRPAPPHDILSSLASLIPDSMQTVVRSCYRPVRHQPELELLGLAGE